MANSIVSNSAAYFAQQNLKSAGSKTELSIARLSSGNRIIRAADDVAALSIGTVLRSNVSTLKTALTNTQQANSLLQVADGGLKNIAEILQRQKSLSVQANSGTLGASERAYLDQEFQSLRSEIDRLVENTKFNAVTLLNGSLSKAVSATFNVEDGTSTLNTGSTATINASATNGQTMTINGVTITFTSSTFGSADAEGKVVIGAVVTDTVSNLVSFLNSSTDARLSAFRYVQTAAQTFAIQWGGGNINSGTTISIAAGTFTSLTAGNAGFTAVTSGGDGLSVGRIRANGSVSGSIIRDFGEAVTGGSTILNGGIDIRNVRNNEDFIGTVGSGNFGNFEVTYDAVSAVNMRVTVGDITYVANSVTMTGTTDFTVTFTGYNDTTSAGGSFVLRFEASAITAVTGQGDADDIEERLNQAFSTVTFAQNRDITSFSGTEIVTTDGVQTANLYGMKADFLSSDFSNVQIEDIKVTAAGFGETDAQIEVTINGERYRTYAGLGTQVATNTVISFGGVDDPNKSFYMVTGATTVPGFTGIALRIEDDAQAASLEAALERAFGVEDGSAKLEFQTGGAATDSIGVEIKSAESTVLYSNLSLNVTTANDAQIASTQLDIAINYVTALRADVGALQSRFDYAGANLEVSIQNQDAARSTFLDTDISSESTAFANAQVLQQASISVLAQANLLPQNLLKLIG